jgi:flagellar basal-body rod protein FlgB
MPIDLIGSVTSTALRVGLDAAALRHQAIAINIANVNTDNYVPFGVNFDAQIVSARRSLNEQGSLDPSTLRQVSPYIEPLDKINRQTIKVRLDSEMANLAQNSVHYQALVKGLNSHLGLLMSAASDGKK